MALRNRLLLVLFLLSKCLLAQDEDEEAKPNVNINSNRKYKNEVGLDIAPFQFVLGSSSSGYPSLFYRKHYIKNTEVKSLAGVKITTYHAYRFRVGSNLSFENFKMPNINTNWTFPGYYQYYNRNTSGNSSFFIRVGKEKQIRVRRFELFYGYDFFFLYNNFYEHYLYIQYYNVGQSDPYSVNQDWTYRDKSYSFGIAPIGGIKYFLIPRLSFSAEATFNVAYFKREKTQTGRNYNNSTQEYSDQTIPLSTNGLQMSINPLYVVNIGYYF